MNPLDVRRDLDALRALFGAIDTLLDLDPAVLSAVAPSVSGWSPEQHVAHVALANELVLRNLKSLAKGSGMLVVKGGEAHPRALELLAAGRLPRGEAEAPRMVRPPEKVERELLLQWLADGKRELASIDAAQLVASDMKIPHQILGPLDAPQWARFGAVHARHHLVIVLEVLRSIGVEKLPDLASLEAHTSSHR
ncbi:MAG: DinB family protein [Planctomycetes bacterium]|nr:DinB family protein [Planctomycetota bacterium]